MVNKNYEEVRKYGGRKSVQHNSDIANEILKHQSGTMHGYRYDKSDFDMKRVTSPDFLFASGGTMGSYYNGNGLANLSSGECSNQTSFGMCAGNELDMNRYFAYDGDAPINSDSLSFADEGPFTFASASDLMRSYASGDTTLHWDGFEMRSN